MGGISLCELVDSANGVSSIRGPVSLRRWVVLQSHLIVVAKHVGGCFLVNSCLWSFILDTLFILSKKAVGWKRKQRNDFPY